MKKMILALALTVLVSQVSQAATPVIMSVALSGGSTLFVNIFCQNPDPKQQGLLCGLSNATFSPLGSLYYGSECRSNISESTIWERGLQQAVQDEAVAYLADESQELSPLLQNIVGAAKESLRRSSSAEAVAAEATNSDILRALVASE